MKKLVYAIVLLFAVSLFAAVTFDPATGTGFVGKGDVQLAYGWNNKQLQDNATAVTFSYNSTETYAAVCEWWTGPAKNRKEHEVTHTRSTQVAAALDGDVRQVKGQKQFTGFILNGFLGEPIVTGEVPVVGGTCQGGGLDNDPESDKTYGTWVDVTQTGSTGGLYVTHNGVSNLLPLVYVP